MSTGSKHGTVEVAVVSTLDAIRSRPEPETPFRILLMGDFSGRENRLAQRTGARLPVPRLIKIDRDNFEDVMERLHVKIDLPMPGLEEASLPLQFSELDHFHPDHVYGNRIFETFRETRKRLADPKTYESAAREVREWSQLRIGQSSDDAPGRSTERAPDTQPPPGGSSGLLDQVIELSAGTESAPAKPRIDDSSNWNTFLRKLVEPHLVRGDDPDRDTLVDAVDGASAKLMRSILHHPEFQAVEASWRALYFLVAGTETDSALELYMLDISKSELKADLIGCEELDSAEMYKLLVKESVNIPGGVPWSLLAGNYSFHRDPEDVALLGRMAGIACLAGAPFIAAAGSGLLGCPSLAEAPDPRDWREPMRPEEGRAWTELRQLTESAYLGLALPRFLLRLPYGEETDPVERFGFEEMALVPDHDHYLWGNPCFVCARLIAEAFSHNGWDMKPGDFQEIEGLPLHIYKDRGESKAIPCAEVLLSVKAVDKILDEGFMPLISFKERDTIRLARFQSIADPPAPLAGRWR
jgi:type VI secretion system protein ImpC